MQVSRTRTVVLLADGSPGDRAMYASHLRLSGFGVIECPTTSKALNHAAEADVVVTGIRVPGPFDGVELVRRLRTRHDGGSKPIIVLTTCSTEPDQMRATQAGCDLFLPKPCLPETLIAHIRRAIDLDGRHEE